MICPECLKGFDPDTPSHRFCTPACKQKSWQKRSRARLADNEKREHEAYEKEFGKGWVRWGSVNPKRALDRVKSDFGESISDQEAGYMAVSYAIFGRDKTLRHCLAAVNS